MADPFTGAAVGVLFQQLYAGASKLINNYIDFEPLLGDLARTLAALNPLIQNINAQNIAAYPNEVIENLKKDIVEGLNLVRKYSEAGAVAGCLKKPTTYTTQIRKLDASLRRQLEILNAHQIWVANHNNNLLTRIAEALNIDPKYSEPNYRHDLVCHPIEVDDCSSLPLLVDDHNDAVPDEIKSNTSTVSGSQRAGVWFLSNVLNDNHKKLIRKSTIFAPLLKDSVLSSLDSYGPLLKQMEASSNEELGYPKKEVERVKAHMEEGIKIVEKCSKVRVWHVNRRSKYANMLLKWDGDLKTLLQLALANDVKEILVMSRETQTKLTQTSIIQERLLKVLQAQGVRDGKETLISVERIERSVTEIEMSSIILESGVESLAATSRHMEKALSGVEMKSGDVLEGMYRIEDRVETNSSNMEAEIKRTEDRLDTRNEAKGGAWCVVPQLAQFTVGLDEPLKESKMRLRKDGVSMLVVTAPGECGETTLATNFCQHKQVREEVVTSGMKHSNSSIVVVGENLNPNEQVTREVEENSDSFTEEVGTSGVKEHSTSSTEEVVSAIETNSGIQKQTDIVAQSALPEIPNVQIAGLALPSKELQNQILKYVNCSDDAHSTSVSNDDVSVPIQTTSLKIPELRTVFPPRLRQPQNKKKRLEPKTHISSSDESTLLSPTRNASTHHHMPSSNSTITIEFCQEHSSGKESVVDGQVRKHILPVDLERYGIEESSHLSRVGMQDMYLAMQRFHVMSTRLVQSEERIAVLETNYQIAEESWKLEKQKLSEQLNFAMAQVASLTKENDSLAEKNRLLEKNKVTAHQEAQEILTKEWEPEFRRQIQEAEKECFKLGCRVGFKSYSAKAENKFPDLDLSDISDQFEPTEFDMKVIEDFLSPDYDNEAENDSDHSTNHSNEEEGNDEQRGGKTAAEVPGDALERLYHYAVHDMIDGTTITVNMEKEVLGVAKPMYILREDVMQFKEMTPISATCINVYMRHLYEVLKQSKRDAIVCFCEASSISVGTPDGKSQVLATRLQQLSTNQILLVPYNSGCHWTLTFINEEKNICYYMDPIHSPIDPVGWKSIVNNGIEQLNYHQTGEALQKRPIWKVVKGPKQPSNVECGYYVMRYMKEMVEDKSLPFAMKWDSKKYFSAYKETERAYTKTEVHEVQLEWASLVYEQKLRG